MRNPKIIHIIKTDHNTRQVQFAELIFWDYENLQEAKDFAINYEYGQSIEIVVDGKIV
jgi:hypothetical protein